MPFEAFTVKVKEGIAENIAVIVLSLFIVIVRGLSDPEASPSHPVKTSPAAGIAVTVVVAP